ncbi:MAG: hypothetical protein HOV94_29940 [Saccharothrix sp.]|nr:hypothetical protein [Saccharothrix sp.]
MVDVTRHGARWIAAVGAALVLVACGGDEDAAPEAPETTNESAPQYFASDQYLGETVTIVAEVTDVYFAGGLGIDAGKWGDETVLALSKDNAGNIGEGDAVQVTGRVERFVYEDYAVSHGLVNEGMYERYSGERFLDVDVVEPATS